MRLRARLKRWLYGSFPGMSGRFPYFGFRVYFPPRSYAFIAACEAGIFEADVVRLMQHLSRPGTHVFDVGANIGLMALPILRHCPTCSVVSFEPSPNSLPYLRRTVAESGCDLRWSVVDKAVSDHSGESDFAIGDSSDAIHEGLESSDRVRNPRLVKVPVTTLDAEWVRLGRPDVSVIKIDIEGAEGLALGGAHELLRSKRPSVIVEWQSRHLRAFGIHSEELLSVAQQFGYGVFSIPHGVPIDGPRTLGVQMLTSYNFLLAP